VAPKQGAIKTDAVNILSWNLMSYVIYELWVRW